MPAACCRRWARCASRSPAPRAARAGRVPRLPRAPSSARPGARGRLPGDRPAPVHARLARRGAPRHAARRDCRRGQRGELRDEPSRRSPPTPRRSERLARRAELTRPAGPRAALDARATVCLSVSRASWWGIQCSLLRARRGVHQHRPAERLDPGGLVGQPKGTQGERLGGGADGKPGRRARACQPSSWARSETVSSPGPARL